MKKQLILWICMVLLLGFAGCSGQPDTPVATPTAETVSETQTPIPTDEEETPEPEPKATPDVDAYSKLMIEENEYEQLLAQWPLESPIYEQGNITSYGMNSQFGFDTISINVMIESEESAKELMETYGNIIEGEWEDDEYSAGPAIYGGSIGDDISATCQIINGDTLQTVFIGLSYTGEADMLDNMVESHCPIGLIPAYETFGEDTLHFNELTIEPASSVSVSRTYLVQDTDSVMEFYKLELSDFEQYNFTEGEEYTSPKIECIAQDVEITVTSSEEMGTVTITYMRPY